MSQYTHENLLATATMTTMKTKTTTPI